LLCDFVQEQNPFTSVFGVIGQPQAFQRGLQVSQKLDEPNADVVENDFFQPWKCQFVEGSMDRGTIKRGKHKHTDSRGVFLTTVRR